MVYGLACDGRRSGRQARAGRAARRRVAVSRGTGLGWGRQVLHRRTPAAAARLGAQPEVNLVTALVPSDTACLLSSPAGARWGGGASRGWAPKIAGAWSNT